MLWLYQVGNISSRNITEDLSSGETGASKITHRAKKKEKYSINVVHKTVFLMKELEKIFCYSLDPETFRIYRGFLKRNMKLLEEAE